MITMPYPYECVIMTTQPTGMPHADFLRATNPELKTHECVSAHEEPRRQHLWRNADRNIREWWRIHREMVPTEQVLFLEYDVLVNEDLRACIPLLASGAGIAGAKVMRCVKDSRKFWPFAEVPRLPREMHALATAIAPLAVILASRPALDAVLDPAFDVVFNKDIFSELRLPTLVRWCGFDVQDMNLQNVHSTPINPPRDMRGIFHPVK